MDDDIRDRFRGGTRRDPTPTSYGRQKPPVRPEESQKSAKKPASKPAWASILSGSSKPSSPQPRISPPAKPSSPVKKSRFKLFKRGKKRSKKLKKKKLLLGFLVLVLIAGGVFYGLQKGKKTDQQFEQTLKTPTESSEESKPTGTIRFIAVGDSLAFESINNAAKQPDGRYNYLPMMAGFKPFFDKSDIRLCNQATSGGGEQAGLSISGYPSFNAPTEWSSGFASLGCNVINLASENMNDKGQPAIDATLGTWDSAENILAVAGANRSAEEQAKIRYFTVKGLKVAYLSYATRSINTSLTPHGLNMYSDELATAQITEARKNAQMVIVSINWGTENSNDINPDQERIAQHLAGLNVDVVVGSGPNVLQPAKMLDGTDGHQTLIWFSLGNFLGSQLPVNNLIGGMAVMDYDVATQKLSEFKLLPVYMHYEWTAAQKAASNLSARHDFMLWPLDLAGEALARSQNNTTVEEQTSRVTGIITKFVPIKVIKSTEF